MEFEKKDAPFEELKSKEGYAKVENDSQRNEGGADELKLVNHITEVVNILIKYNQDCDV